MGRGSKFNFGKTRGYYKSINFSNENLDEKNGTEENAGSAKPQRNVLPTGRSQIMHIFREAENHLPDTPENRELFEALANNAEKKLGTDSIGLDWFADIDEEGRQVWVSSRNGIIQNGGRNPKGKHRPWNPIRGA